MRALRVVQRGMWAKTGRSRCSMPWPKNACANAGLAHRRVREIRYRRSSRRGATRFRLSRREAAHLRFLEQVVAAEDLVGAFAGQHDLVPGGAHAVGEQHQRRRRSAHQRRFRMPDRAGKLRRSRRAAVHGRVVGAQVPHHLHAGARFRRIPRPRMPARRCAPRVGEPRISATMPDESSPPERYAPTGTSARSCRRTASTSSSRSSSAACSMLRKRAGRGLRGCRESASPSSARTLASVALRSPAGAGRQAEHALENALRVGRATSS